MYSLRLLILFLPQLWVGLVHAQTNSVTQILANAPSCAHHCIIDAFATSRCNLSDVAACVCTNITLQTGLSECTQTSCLFADQVTAASIEMDLCAAYPTASKSWEVTRTTIVGCVLVLPTIALRLYTRIAYTKKLWTDDYATILATILLVILAAVDLYNANQGLGMHYWTVPVEKGTLVLKLFYFNSMIYMILLVVGKMSILLVYLRIFPSPQFRYVVYGMNAFLVFHGLLYFLLTALQCLPVESIWDRYITDRKCINANAIVYSSGLLSIFEDVAILLLPVRQVWRLNIHRRRRLTLLALFSIGSFACLTSMVRMKYVVQYSATFDATWDSVNIVVWSAIEQFSALLCGSLPALRPLLASIVPKVYSNARDRVSYSIRTARRSSVPQSVKPLPSVPERELPGIPGDGPPAELPSLSDKSRATGGDAIRVTTTVELSWESWFDERSQDEAEDEEQGHNLPQQPPPVYSKD